MLPVLHDHSLVVQSVAAGHYVEQGIFLFFLYLPLLVAFVLAFRVLGFFDLSLAAASVLVAYVFNTLSAFMPGPYAALGALAINFLCGAILCTLVYLHFIRRKTPSAQMLIVSLGVMTVISSAIALLWGQQPFAITYFNSFNTVLAIFSGISISRFELFYVLACTVSLILFLLFIRCTRQGLWIQAMIDNRFLAEDAGVPIVPLTIAMEGICFFFAGITGIGQAVFTYVTPSVDFASFIIIIGAALLGTFKFGRSILALAVLVAVNTIGIALINTAFAAMLMYGIILVALIAFYGKSIRPAV